MSASRWRYVAAHLRHGAGQAVTAGAGIVVAAASFSLLTAAVATNQVQTQGAVASSFRATYDVLVRPLGTQTPLEAQQGLVRPNFETGIYGGITHDQWRAVLGVAGVEVAAPVAYLGYPSTFTRIQVPVDRFITDAPEQLLRLRTWSVADNGLSRYPGATPYVFVTSKKNGCEGPLIASPDQYPNAFAASGPSNSYLRCYERSSLRKLSTASTKATVEIVQPVAVLVAAIDPEQENRLVGLDHGLTSGRPLSPAAKAGAMRFGSTLPVIAADRSYVDEPLHAEVERVDPPRGKTLAQVLDNPAVQNANGDESTAPNAAYRQVIKLPGQPAGHLSIPYDTIYSQYLHDLTTEVDPTTGRPYFGAYWSIDAAHYGKTVDNHLVPEPVSNDPEVVYSQAQTNIGTNGNSYGYVTVDNADVQFRKLNVHAAQPQIRGIPGSSALRVVGTFDPTKLQNHPAGAPESGTLSAVPLEAYAPPLVEPADPASKTALGGRPLGPSANVGGYVSQPPALLTTLSAAEGMTNPKFFDGANHAAPISVIRVRVAGVTGPDQQSLERIRRVATGITAATGLHVDITAGSSPEPQLVQLPAGKYGRPPLLVSEPWSRKGVAVVILSAVDTKSAALFGLVLAVTIGLLLNTALATVRTRRREIGILLATGWAPRHVFSVILSELALIGAVAGIVGAGVAAGLISLLDLDLSWTRVLLVPPVAVALAVVAGLSPAVVAARGRPVDVVTPSITTRRSRHRPPTITRTLTGLARRNLSRRPGRTAVAASCLFLGVVGVTALVGINTAYHKVVVGTLLGNYVATAARTVDYLAVALALFLAGVSIANTLILDHTERAPELATLQATGWAPRHLAYLTVDEAAGIGLIGSIPGAILGAAIAILAGAPTATTALTAAAAVVGGTTLAILAGFLPAQLAARTHPATAINDR